ncbi:MAG: hypothetical protein GY757_10180 [bacterium]|nr:hypothetical protein [bacterium]
MRKSVSDGVEVLVYDVALNNKIPFELLISLRGGFPSTLGGGGTRRGL